MIKTVIFDMDGVLLDTERMMTECSLTICKKLGVENAEQLALENAGVAGSEIRKKMGEILGGGYNEGKRFYQKFGALYVKRLLLEGIPVKENIEETLKYLKEHGYTLAVASTTKTPLVKLMLSICGLKKYFDSIMGGDKVENRKPAPDIYLKSMEKIGKTSEECYAVEDSLVGAKASIDAGIKTIIIPDLQEPNEYNKENAYKIFDSAKDLLEFFKKENEEPN